MFQSIIRSFFLFLDKIVYGILEVIFQLIVDLAHFQLFTSETINSFRNRIYLILGLVMVFKLIISFIQILIDPSKMDDKEQGVGGVLKRVIVSMVLIVLVPSIFDLARQLQDYILPVIPKVVVGVNADLSNEEMTTSAGRVMSYYSFLPFFYYADEENCNTGALAGTGSDNPTISRVADISDKILNEKKCSTVSDEYTYRYQYFISTLVGAYLVYVLVTVAVKIAIRAIKFSLCEIIAPIPIASYIDPKQSKESFDNWVKTSVKVYIDLFTRLIVVYFVIYIFMLLFNGENGNKFQATLGQFGFIRGMLVILFIIVGLLNFAKDMPKFVSDMLGVKDGFSDIGDMFRGQGFRAIRDAGQFVSNPLAIAGSNAINTWRQNSDLTVGRRLRRTLGSALAGGTSTAFRSGGALLGGQDLAEAARRGREGAIAARRNRATDRDAGVTARDRADVRRRDYFGIDSRVTFGEQQIKSAEAMLGDISKFKGTMTTLYKKYADDIQLSGSGVQNEVSNMVSRHLDAFNDPNVTRDIQEAGIRLQEGKGTYADLLAVKRFAQENSGKSAAFSKLADALQDDNATMRNIQKAMFEQTLRGELKDASGNTSKDLNRGLDTADDDLKNVINTMRQTYNSNASTLGLSVGEFDNAANNLFGGLEKTVKKTRDEAQINIGDTGRTEAVARESLQRRQQNSQRNGNGH